MSTPAKILAEATIPTPTGTLNLHFEAGTSTIIIGANGSGKTRLGVYLDQVLSAKDVVHRIAAQKMLALDEVQVIALEYAEAMLRYGMQTALPTQRINYRWQNKPVTHLLNDFQALLQTLFAQHNRAAVRFFDVSTNIKVAGQRSHRKRCCRK